MVKLQTGIYRWEFGFRVENFWHWYRKWLTFNILPYLQFRYDRGNRAHLEPHRASLGWGWLTFGGSVWLTWPYENKDVEISYLTKQERGQG